MDKDKTIESKAASNETAGSVPLQSGVSCGAMVREYLEKNGYDGLFAEDAECGCCLDDLMPCGGDYVMGCEAGYKRIGCNNDCGEGCDFHIVPRRS